MSILDNVNRILRHYGLDKDVAITKVEVDRAYGWAYNSKLLEFVIAKNWNPDDRVSSKIHHGTQFSFREPGGVRPSLQIGFHPCDTAIAKYYFLEFDFDYASPAGGFKSFLTHAREVVSNFFTRGKTDQTKVEQLLEKRGIE